MTKRRDSVGFYPVSTDAWQDAGARGPGWRKRADEGLRALRAVAPAQADVLVAGQ